MFDRRRPLLRAAAVGGVAYAAGHHMATKSAQQSYTDAQQNAQLKQLGELHVSGVLTDAEFEAVKKKLLGRS
jgi:hypothetical protein